MMQIRCFAIQGVRFQQIQESQFINFWRCCLWQIEEMQQFQLLMQKKRKMEWVKAKSLLRLEGKGQERAQSLKEKVMLLACCWQHSWFDLELILKWQYWMFRLREPNWIPKSNFVDQVVQIKQVLVEQLMTMLMLVDYHLLKFYCLELFFHLPFLQPGNAELPSLYNQKYKTSIPPFLPNPSSSLFSIFPLQVHNNFIMAQNFDSEKRINEIEKKMVGGALHKSEQQKKREIFEYDNQEFMVPMAEPTNNNPPKGQAPAPQIKKSMVLSKADVERSLTDIYNYYIRVYEQPSKEYSQFDAIGPRRLDIKGFLLFAKNFGILKTIFSLDRMNLIFKKHADFGKYLSFDNFYFTINSMSHEQEVKSFFHLDSMLMNLDIETIEELEKQEFYNYLQLKDPDTYRKKFTELFGSFNIKDKPRATPLKYNYRKFSLPELRKKALLQPRQKKKGQKDLFILKNDRQVHQNVFDEAKSIVVSWDSLRAKSVNNLGKPAQLVQKKYLKIDPQEDPYLQEVRPASRPSPKSAQKNERQAYQKQQQHYANKIEKKIKEIQQSQNIKNKQILNRIQKKLKLPSSRKLQV